MLLQYTMFASCAGNSDLIDFLEQNLASFSLRSSNWSTRVHEHSAAICRQNSALFHLLYIYHVSKNQNRAISQNLAVSVRFGIFYNFPHEYNHDMFRNGITSLKNLLKHPEIIPELFPFLPDMLYRCSTAIVQDKKRRTVWTSPYFNFSKFKVLINRIMCRW